jgi:hypothetical protein
MPTIIAAGDTALGNMVPATLLTGASPTTGGATTQSPLRKAQDVAKMNFPAITRSTSRCTLTPGPSDNQRRCGRRRIENPTFPGPFKATSRTLRRTIANGADWPTTEVGPRWVRTSP